MEQDSPDGIPAERDAREGGHARPQTHVRVFYDELDAIRGLPILIRFAFAADLRHNPPKDVVRKRTDLETDGVSNCYVANLTLRQLNAKEQVTCVGDSQDLRALLKVLTGQARYVFAKHDSWARRRQFEPPLLATQEIATRLERLHNTFELLKLLIEARPRALSKTELLERVWPGVFVSEASLARVVNQIRNAVGDTARHPRILRTVHAYGYAFIAEAVDDGSPDRHEGARLGRCWLTCGRREFPLDDGDHIVGREPDATVWLESPKVSRQHARLTVKGPHATIMDLASKNGTIVRGNRISAPLDLVPGTEIRIGPFTLVFRTGIEAGSTETELTSRVQRE